MEKGRDRERHDCFNVHDRRPACAHNWTLHHPNLCKYVLDGFRFPSSLQALRVFIISCWKPFGGPCVGFYYFMYLFDNLMLPSCGHHENHLRVGCNHLCLLSPTCWPWISIDSLTVRAAILNFVHFCWIYKAALASLSQSPNWPCYFSWLWESTSWVASVCFNLNLPRLLRMLQKLLPEADCRTCSIPCSRKRFNSTWYRVLDLHEQQLSWQRLDNRAWNFSQRAVLALGHRELAWF
jgi:hypothetical protein